MKSLLDLVRHIVGSILILREMLKAAITTWRFEVDAMASQPLGALDINGSRRASYDG